MKIDYKNIVKYRYKIKQKAKNNKENSPFIFNDKTNKLNKYTETTISTILEATIKMSIYVYFC